MIGSLDFQMHLSVVLADGAVKSKAIPNHMHEAGFESITQRPFSTTFKREPC